MTRDVSVATINKVKKVLVVESLKPLLEREKSILSNRGLEIIAASSGEEALALHKSEKADLIISRLDMTGMGGDTLCSLVRQDSTLKNVSFLMVCENTKGDIEKCQKCGANSYVSRPLDPERLLEKVGRLIDIPKRTGIRVLIKVSVKGDLDNQPFFCSSVNLSTAGILLEVDKTISRGDLVTCSFFIPGSDSITADGEIARVVKITEDTYHWGVKFVNLPGGHKAAIEAFVKKKA